MSNDSISIHLHDGICCLSFKILDYVVKLFGGVYGNVPAEDCTRCSWWHEKTHAAEYDRRYAVSISKFSLHE